MADGTNGAGDVTVNTGHPWMLVERYGIAVKDDTNQFAHGPVLRDEGQGLLANETALREHHVWRSRPLPKQVMVIGALAEDGGQVRSKACRICNVVAFRRDNQAHRATSVQF